MELTLPDANAVLQHYDLGYALSLTRLHSGFANQNYKLTTNKKDVLLRVCREQSDENIQYEMTLLGRLRAIEFPAAFPLPRSDGEFLTSLFNDPFSRGSSDGTPHTPFPGGTIVLYQFIPGEEPRSTPETVREIGIAIAQLNTLSEIEGLERRNGLDLALCQQVIGEYDCADYAYPSLFDAFKTETNLLEDALREDLPRGLIHGDAFPDNTIFQGNELRAILDWEEACTDTLLIDVGVTINGFCFPGNELDGELLLAFLGGYESVRILTERERKLLPYFIRWGAHCLIAWHLAHIIHEPDPRKLERAMMFTERLAKLKNLDPL
jgi:homoserine kinase type II